MVDESCRGSICQPFIKPIIRPTTIPAPSGTTDKNRDVTDNATTSYWERELKFTASMPRYEPMPIIIAVMTISFRAFFIRRPKTSPTINSILIIPEVIPIFLPNHSLIGTIGSMISRERYVYIKLSVNVFYSQIYFVYVEKENITMNNAETLRHIMEKARTDAEMEYGKIFLPEIFQARLAEYGKTILRDYNTVVAYDEIKREIIRFIGRG